MKKSNLNNNQDNLALSTRNKSNPHNPTLNGMDRNMFGTIGNTRLNPLGSTKSILANHANKINMGLRNELNSI